MARLRRRMQSYRVGDARLFLAPFYIVILLLLLSHDMDNLVMQVVFNWVVPAITIYLSSQWVPIGARAAGAGALAPGARVAGIPRGAAPQTAFR